MLATLANVTFATVSALHLNQEQAVHYKIGVMFGMSRLRNMSAPGAFLYHNKM